LRAVDGALSQAGDVLNRAATLAAQAANDAQESTQGSRDLISGEIEGIFRHLAAIANSAHSGKFVFGGSTDDISPFVIDPASPDGVVYQGDSGSRQIIFPDGRAAQISLPGNSVFAQPEFFLGSGRTPYTAGSALPNPPVGVGVAFSGDLDAVLSVDVPGFFVAAAPPGVPAGGETISVTLTSTNGSISGNITTAPLPAGADTLQIAAALNTALVADPQLNSGFTFSSADGTATGALKLVQSDTLGVGFSFTSTATGGLTSGLEPGGVVGGQSAEEIASLLNTAAAGNPNLTTANVQFSAVNGEVQVDGDVDFTINAVDFDRGTGFVSGLAGAHNVGGTRGANVFGVLNQLIADLNSGNQPGIAEAVSGLRRSIEHISGSQSFYGSTQRQVDLTLGNLSSLDVVNHQRLSQHQDADLVKSIGDMLSSSTAEQFILQVASQQQPTLLDLLA
jgi:flagellin-like hook-associated protein FlgL